LQSAAVCCDVFQGVTVYHIARRSPKNTTSGGVCCSVCQCVAVCCSVLQCVTVCHTARRLPIMPSGFMCKAVVRRLTWPQTPSVRAAFPVRISYCVFSSVHRTYHLCCSVLQCVAASCSVSFLSHTAPTIVDAVRCRALLCVAVCCSVLR